MTTPQTDRLGTLRPIFTRALVYLLCSLTATPAWSARGFERSTLPRVPPINAVPGSSAGSTLYQVPPFTATEPPANVIMMLDDSNSMSRHDLPTPVAIKIDNEKVATKVTIWGEGADSTGIWAERSWEIDRDYDWVLRAPALNPLWYNPANRYLPWNNDGKLMANASIGGSVATTNHGAFTARANAAELTERDPRHKPDGSGGFVSITNAAGRGLLGTDSRNDAAATKLGTRGRSVIQVGGKSDYWSNNIKEHRHHNLPFDFGPTLPGATSAPRNGHADLTWTTHDNEKSPLDLFSRPLQAGSTIKAPPGVPDPLALTPARYYYYTGKSTDDKAKPEHYKVVQIDRTRPAAVFTVIDATTGQAATDATSQRSDCAAKTSCTWLEEAQNYANWYLYYRNRLFAAQAVLADSLSSMTSSTQQSLRVGYGQINYRQGHYDAWTGKDRTDTLVLLDDKPNPGALVRGVRPFIVGSDDRKKVFNWLFSVSWTDGTPNREAVDSVGRYFSRDDNKGPWGATPGTEDLAPQLACRRNSLLLTTDGEWNNPKEMSSSGPLSGSGSPKESDYVAGPKIEGHGPNAGASFTYDPANWKQFTGGSSKQPETLTDAAVYYWNHDLRPNLDNVIAPVTDSVRPNPAFWQSMSTYIIGFGLTASMDTLDTRAAVASGANVDWPAVNLEQPNSPLNRVNDSLRAALASRGNFYSALTVPELKTSILSSFLEAGNRGGSAGGVAVTSAVITGTSQAFFPSYTTGKWTGSLKAYKSADLKLLARGDPAKPDWTASLPAFGARNILSSNARKSPTYFNVDSLNAPQRNFLRSTTAGFSYTAAEAVNYLRGDQSLELPATGITAGKKFRRRESILGDIVNSPPLYVKAPDYGYGAMPTIGRGYATYVKGRRDGTVSTVYVGANDGMFHAFDAATGIERFAYVPRGVYPTLANLLNPGYEHNYYVDGPVTAGDWHDGSVWRSMVIGTTGAGGANGGSSVFAIDITSQASITTDNVKWDVTAKDSEDLGHILNRGIVGRIKDSKSGDTKWVYMVGNGYESKSNKAALLVFDIATGDMTSIPVGPTWTTDSGDAGRNGMGGITVVHDSERNIKLVYGGDRQGNLWRFDFSSGTPAVKGFQNDSTPLFTAVNGTVRRPISAAPRLVPHPLGGMLVIFGTGKLYDTTDNLDRASQGIYAIWDKPQYTGSTITSAAGQIKQLKVTGDAGSTRTIDTAVDWDKFMGWSAQLTDGERVIADATAEAGSLTVTSYAPSAALDACNGGGKSYVYRFSFATGIITGVPVTGVVGAVGPLTEPPTSTTRSATGGVDISSGISGTGTGGTATPDRPPGSTSQCFLYSTNIQGRPNMIAVDCPNFAPMRVWRQQVR